MMFQLIPGAGVMARGWRWPVRGKHYRANPHRKARRKAQRIARRINRGRK